MHQKIWYASYGSNILEKRFLHYILGGQPKGSKKEYKGCTDKTPPSDKEELYIKGELYFAKQSKTWNNGGVAFLNTDVKESVFSLGRMYLITPGQYVEIVKQETNYDLELIIDFNKAIKSGSTIFRKGSWYGKLYFLGYRNEHPIFTFTNENYLHKYINPPSKEYLLQIINGIKETYNLNEIEINEYLQKLNGIRGYDIENQLELLVQ